jgi:hypothetical protein
MPPFVHNLFDVKEKQQKVGHWRHAIRNGGIGSFLTERADGFFFSCLAQPNRSVQVRAHDSNLRLIALHQEMPHLNKRFEQQN